MSHAQNSPLSPPLSPPPHPPHASSSPPITAPLTRSPLSNRSNLDLTRWDYKDSSEGQPSSHESLYDASRVSTSDRAKSPYQTAAATAVVRPITPPPRSLRGAIDLDSESPLSRLETPFLYGHGTELAPILEQRSIATLRTGSFSTSDVSSLMHGAPPSSSKSKPFNENGNDEYDEDSDFDFGCSYNSSNSSPRAPLLMRQKHQQQQQHQLRRRQSFSLDDLPLVYPTSGRSPEKEPVAVTESPSLSSSSSPLRSRPRLSAPVYAHPTTVEVAADVYAYPQRPLYPAHQSPQTPPGLATLMEHQGQGQGQHRRRQGTSSHDAPPFSAFRAQRSAHGNLASHPFMRRHGGTSITSGENSGNAAPHTVFVDAPPLPPAHTHAHALVDLDGDGDGDLGVPPPHRALALTLALTLAPKHAQPEPEPGPETGAGGGAGRGVVPRVRAARGRVVEPDADGGGAGAGRAARRGVVHALRVPEGGGAGVVVVVLLRSGVG
ncbi:hypothetical protein F4809DRAFT_662077 [Biscogniauxia mediterranea]|nr:hypothetical protein F4809DRAFT_662077 [Biscogniauxia mediterranea]